MKQILPFLFTALTMVAFAQVPNPGFENWTAGNPDLWTTNNAVGFATPVTQTTPAYAGNLAVRGEVINSIAGVIEPLLSSMDISGNGFAISQSYTLFNFYYKCNVTGTAALTIAIYLSDLGGNVIAAGGQLITGSVGTYTQASIPIFYSGTNPVECIILVVLADTAGGTSSVGDFFVLDELTLGFGSGVNTLQPVSASINGIWPNPSSVSANVNFSLPAQGDVSFAIYNVEGRKVMETTLENQAAGTHAHEFDVATLPSGVYSLKMFLPASNTTRQQKLVIVR